MKIEIEIDDSLVTTHKPVAIRKPKDGDIVRNVYSGQFYYYNEIEESKTAVIYEKIKQYREPVLPADACKECEFSSDEKTWSRGILLGYLHHVFGWKSFNSNNWKFARIEVTDEV